MTQPILSPRLMDVSRTLTRTDADDLPLALSEAGARSWGEFAIAVNNWRTAFVRAGVSSAALYLEDLFDFSSALFGAWCAGVRAILPADATRATCARLAGLAQALAGEFDARLAAADAPDLPLITPADTGMPFRGEIDPEARLVSLFTSGSTGEPALITKRLSQLFCEVAAIETRRPDASERNLAQDAVIFSTVPAQHIYGLLFTVLWPAAAVRPFWHRRILYPEELLSRTRRAAAGGAALWVTSPAQLKRLPRDLDWRSIRDILRVVYSSGGPLPPEGLQRCLDCTGISPVEILGSSESGGIAWRSRGIAPDGRITGEAFRALPGMQVKSENGLLALKGAQLSSPGWECTADRVRLLSDGSFMLLGRADRIVKIEEKRVSLAAVEKALTATRLVTEARAFVAPCTGKLAVAAIPAPQAVALIRREGKRALVSRLRTALAQGLERVCLPRHWRFVWELPENAMGKHTARELEALLDPARPQAVLESRTGESAELLVSVASDAPFFEGHFPEFKLLPGLVQVDWACSLARRLLGVDAPLAGIRSLKFMAPILPGDTVLLRLSRTAAGVSFVYESLGEEKDRAGRRPVHAKGTLLFAGSAAAGRPHEAP